MRSGLAALLLAAAFASSAFAQTAPARGHVLQGAWKIHWIEQGKVSDLQIAEVFPQAGVTHFTGSMTDVVGERCAVEGDVYDTLSATLAAGLEQKTLRVSAFVVVRGLCPAGRQMWIEALGLPGGAVLMSGRATNISDRGTKSVYPVALGR